MGDRPPTLRWTGDLGGHVELIEQTLLPAELVFVDIDTPEKMWDAIKRLAVRGAPAIGVAAGYGVYLGVQDSTDAASLRTDFARTREYLATSRPTAVNLFWALDRMQGVLDRMDDDEPDIMRARLLAEARKIHDEDESMCAAIGRHGAALVPEGGRLLTHCNAGALATGGMGTALAVMFAAKDDGRNFEVFVDETRPLLQGARLTSWELMQAGIPAILITDSSAAHVMKTKGVDLVVVGSDRLAANGDAANKIGTYSVAVNAKAHGVPFYVAAPSSTFDMSLESGDLIPIEERASEEITELAGQRTAPEGVRTFAPAFDVTPAELITGIVTEKGLIQPVTVENVRRVILAD